MLRYYWGSSWYNQFWHWMLECFSNHSSTFSLNFFYFPWLINIFYTFLIFEVSLFSLTFFYTFLIFEVSLCSANWPGSDSQIIAHHIQEVTWKYLGGLRHFLKECLSNAYFFYTGFMNNLCFYCEIELNFLTFLIFFI